MDKIKDKISQLIGYIKKDSESKDLPQSFFDFLELFYAQNQLIDFAGYSQEDLKSAALRSYKCFSKKKINESKVQVNNDKNLNFATIEIVNDDSPFLVDSIVGLLDKFSIEVKNIIHPVLSTARDSSGNLLKVAKSGNQNPESVIQIHIKNDHLEINLDEIKDKIIVLLQNIKFIVADFSSMKDLAAEAFQSLENNKAKIDLKEIKDFFDWIINGNFIFLSALKFDVVKKGQGFSLKETDIKYGVSRSNSDDFRPKINNLSIEEVTQTVTNPYYVEILKSSYKSEIHRIANAERIRVQGFSKSGELVYEYRFTGLFTSSAYNQSANLIPLIRHKIATVIEKSGFPQGGHNYKDLISVLESYPRDELFQISAEDLLRISSGIVAICGRQQVRLFNRVDKFARFVSCLVFAPRNRSNSQVREQIRNHLANAYNGMVTDHYLFMTSSNMMRMNLIIKTNGTLPKVDESNLEKEIEQYTRIWSDDLKEELNNNFPVEKTIKLFKRYQNAFSVSYTNRFSALNAIFDINKIEESLATKSVLFNLYQSDSASKITELKIYSPKEIVLSQIMPILESFGFNMINEHTYTVEISSEEKAFVHYFRLNLSQSGDNLNDEIKKNFEETISLIWTNVIGSGLLNRMIVAANFNWKQINLLRAYMRYIYQAGFRYNQKYISDVLVKNREIAKVLIKIFETKFDIKLKVNADEREDHVEKLLEQIKKLLNNVTDSLEDSVIRKFLAVIEATNRTNYYQSNKDGNSKDYLSFKFDPKRIPDLPLPVPFAEIYVYSAKVEGVHLRGGEVARGGLRWSDRHEDFRTEVLGLMKAQMTKNTVIVPVGSKGGFVVKRSAAGINRDEYLKEGIECYKTFLRGLLDVTDNYINGKVVNPKDVVIHDKNDPYLVVAADKGTATFSDIANSISAEYNFWLGDAFASGGSVGYDHKKMGITAKGGWISVQRHFNEIGLDTQKQDFTCIGIGDLSGDVFGNGMLLSKHIKLVAAFNHLHIFFDPNPDTAKSFKERERMFNLPRSSWTDYDQKLISKGGGIFERNAKTIKLTEEIKKVLNISESELSPTDLIKAILKAPVDLLWNGGIGTYVKASSETNQEVGDRVNDVLRVNGSDLRCKVIGEGGNLGFTQRGRIEYAIKGGKINTDAMDNSAGVDCSDHEVNIKIALTQALSKKKITLEERNQILEKMTDEVADLVLYDNKIQTQAITINESQGLEVLDYQAQFLDRLERDKLLNRAVEFLPSSKEIARRQIDKIGMTRPELCVMLSYCKMDLYNKILESNLVEDEYFESELLSYFPKIMQEKFADEIKHHQLKKEIIATQITNFVANRGGITFVSQIYQNSGFRTVDVIRSFIISYDSFRLREVWDKVEVLDNSVSRNVQTKMFLSMNKLLERSVMWLLHHQTCQNQSIKVSVEKFCKITDELIKILPDVLAKASKEAFDEKIKTYSAEGIDKKLVERIAAMDPLASALDIAEISTQSHFDLKTIAKIYFTVGTRFNLKWMRSSIAEINQTDYWSKLSAKTILEDLYNIQMALARRIVDFHCNEKEICDLNSISHWISHNSALIERFDSFVNEIKSNSNHDISIFIVALNRLKSLIN